MADERITQVRGPALSADPCESCGAPLQRMALLAYDSELHVSWQWCPRCITDHQRDEMRTLERDAYRLVYGPPTDGRAPWQ